MDRGEKGGEGADTDADAGGSSLSSCIQVHGANDPDLCHLEEVVETVWRVADQALERTARHPHLRRESRRARHAVSPSKLTRGPCLFSSGRVLLRLGGSPRAVSLLHFLLLPDENACGLNPSPPLRLQRTLDPTHPNRHRTHHPHHPPRAICARRFRGACPGYPAAGVSVQRSHRDASGADEDHRPTRATAAGGPHRHPSHQYVHSPSRRSTSGFDEC